MDMPNLNVPTLIARAKFLRNVSSHPKAVDTLEPKGVIETLVEYLGNVCKPIPIQN
jgi:hypothetical protein